MTNIELFLINNRMLSQFHWITVVIIIATVGVYFPSKGQTTGNQFN